MTIWNAVVELLQAGVFGLSHVLAGSLPAGILATTLLVRTAMLPLTVAMARRARRHAAAVATLKPRLDAVRARYADQPLLAAEKTADLYRSRGLSLVDPGALRGALLQMPVVMAFYQSVRGLLPSLAGQSFLWIRDLARPSPLLAVVTSAVMLLATMAGSPETAASQPGWVRWVPTAGTLVVMLFVSSGFGLYLLASGAVTGVQAVLVERGMPKTHPER